MTLQNKVEEILYENIPSMRGRQTGKTYVAKRIMSLFHQEMKRRIKSLWADEINGDYTEEEKKNPLIAYNNALKRVLQELEK